MFSFNFFHERCLWAELFPSKTKKKKKPQRICFPYSRSGFFFIIFLELSLPFLFSTFSTFLCRKIFRLYFLPFLFFLKQLLIITYLIRGVLQRKGWFCKIRYTIYGKMSFPNTTNRYHWIRDVTLASKV